MTIEFFMPMIPPTVTHQEKKIHVVKNKPHYYEPEELKDARAKLMANLSNKVPKQKFKNVPLELVTKWCFPKGTSHFNGEYRISKPDTDNLQKLLKDCMTQTGFWQDDALVAREIVEKFWASVPGVYIRVSELEVAI